MASSESGAGRGRRSDDGADALLEQVASASVDELLQLLEAMAELVAARLEAPQHRFLDVLAVQDRICASAWPSTTSVRVSPVSPG